MEKIITLLSWLLAVVFLSTAAGTLYAQQETVIQLPPPQTDIGKPLMQALKLRKTSRAFDEKPLPQQTLSNLLWAAFGINRPEIGKRTAPSARNWQEIDIYAATADGLYRYDAKNHALVRISEKDIRAMTGEQAFVGDAPLNLVYVADYTRMGSTDSDRKEFYAGADTGFISQNVYLFCASEGLATVVRAYMDRPALAKALSLGPDEVITLAQTVGYPAE